VPDELKRERLERVTEVQRLVTAERYERQVGRTVTSIVDRVQRDGKVQARTYGQADDIDGVTWIRPGMAGGGWRMGEPLRPGDLVEVRLDAVSNDYDFEATLVRQLGTASRVMPRSAPRTLPVISTAGAFGR
jgi:ribosomal protein S12 methylthiotransferase